MIFRSEPERQRLFLSPSQSSRKLMASKSVEKRMALIRCQRRAERVTVMTPLASDWPSWINSPELLIPMSCTSLNQQ